MCILSKNCETKNKIHSNKLFFAQCAEYTKYISTKCGNRVDMEYIVYYKSNLKIDLKKVSDFEKIHMGPPEN